QLGVQRLAMQAVEVGVTAPLIHQQLEPLPKGIGAKIVQTGLGAGALENAVHGQIDHQALALVEGLSLHLVQAGSVEVVDANRLAHQWSSFRCGLSWASPD